MSFRFRPLLCPFAVALLPGLATLLWPFRLQDDGLVPRAAVPPFGLVLPPLSGLLWLLFVLEPLLAPLAECVLFPLVLPAPFELQRVPLVARAALPFRAPLLGRVPAGRGAPGLAIPGRAIGARASPLARLAGLLAAEGCPAFRVRDGVAGRLKCGRAPAPFPLAADCRPAGVRGVRVEVWLEAWFDPLVAAFPVAGAAVWVWPGLSTALGGWCVDA